MLFNSPLSTSKADRIIEQFNLKSRSRVLDAGCGEGEFLVRVSERYEIRGFGFDLNPLAIKTAQAKAKQRVKAGHVSFSTQDATEFFSENQAYDLIICIGAEFIFGGYAAALHKLRTVLAPNGLLLMGTVFWKQEPAPEYLQLMGGENPHFDHASTVALASQQNFLPLYICRSSDDEWDDFESSVSQRKYLEALHQLSAPDAAQQMEKVKQWQMGYLRWGMNTMGFGFYLLRSV